jgi:AAA+ ATPase superfamily predicted ATPase
VIWKFLVGLLIAIPVMTVGLAVGHVLEVRDAITVGALLLGPTIAVVITIALQEHLRIRNERIGILRTLIATRHTPLADDRLRTLSLIDVVFFKDVKIRDLWHEYIKIVGMEDFAKSKDIQKQATDKSVELINEMARVLGLGESLTQADIERVYLPKGLFQTWTRNEELANELLRVLKNTRSLTANPLSQFFGKNQ